MIRSVSAPSPYRIFDIGAEGISNLGIKDDDFYISHNPRSNPLQYWTKGGNAERIIDITKDLFDKVGFELCDNPKHVPLIERWKYTCDGIVEPPFGRHVDDYGGIQFKCMTAIYYLRKDDTIEGGGLTIYENADDKVGTTLKTRAGMVMLMRGDVEHTAEKCKGRGIRDCIIVQLPRLDCGGRDHS
jgi:hypothetical protein